MQALLQVVYGHRLLAVEDHQIVAVALMVAEDEGLAVLRAILTPLLTGNLDGRRLGMLIYRIFYAVRVKEIEYPLTTKKILSTHIYRDAAPNTPSRSFAHSSCERSTCSTMSRTAPLPPPNSDT